MVKEIFSIIKTDILGAVVTHFFTDKFTEERR